MRVTSQRGLLRRPPQTSPRREKMPDVEFPEAVVNLSDVGDVFFYFKMAWNDATAYANSIARRLAKSPVGTEDGDEVVKWLEEHGGRTLVIPCITLARMLKHEEFPVDDRYTR
jgi:hypothetical protein